MKITKIIWAVGNNIILFWTKGKFMLLRGVKNPIENNLKWVIFGKDIVPFYEKI